MHVKEELDADITERKALQSKLQCLLEEAKVSRAQGESLRSLGLSLADIAAFMHEVELWMPPVVGTSARDRTRVEQLRKLALMLQNLPSQRPYDSANRKL
ncbi:hypothetical protein BDP27DRAFT_1313368, partial [Rhodocollybia butyracea]